MTIETINGFNDTDRLELSNLPFRKTAAATYDPRTEILTVRSGQYAEKVRLADTDVRQFRAESDGHGDTVVVARDYDGSSTEANAVCYAAGTAIRTSRGEVAVELLTEDDRVVTASGGLRPVRWIGHRVIDCRRHRHPHLVMPVRIAAHAFGRNRPERDLYVSPAHAICTNIVGEVLIPAGVLVNGTSIRQIEVEEIDYWHVELDAHDVILAEGLPAESYLDMGNRGFFRDAKVVAFAALPDIDASSRTHAEFCRPFHAAGPIVDAVRDRLRVLAAEQGRRTERRGSTNGGLVADNMHVDAPILDPARRSA